MKNDRTNKSDKQNCQMLKGLIRLEVIRIKSKWKGGELEWVYLRLNGSSCENEM